MLTQGDENEEEESATSDKKVNGVVLLSPEEKEELQTTVQTSVTLVISKQNSTVPQNNTSQQPIKYNSKEQKITIETDDEGATKPLDSSDGNFFISIYCLFRNSVTLHQKYLYISL